MIAHASKVLLLAARFVIAGMARADSRATNHASNGVVTSQITTLHLQVTQTGARLLNQPASEVTLTDLQSFVTLAQKYFSTRKEIEEPLFRQRLQDKRNFGYPDDYEANAQLGQPYSPSVEQTSIAVFQHYLSANHANSVSALTQFRNILRSLQSMNHGHLSGMTWLYNSPLPPFAEQNLQSLDQQIIETSLASADALRKKRQYTSCIKTYKTLLTDYANTPHEAPINVLLDATIVEDYNYQTKLALVKHDYKKARFALTKIIELYPETAYAKAAEKALQATVPAAVKFYRTEGDKNWRPGDEFLKPQTKAREFYEKAYNEDPNGPHSAEMLYHWAEARASEKGKVPEAIKLLNQWLDKYPKNHPLRCKVTYLLGFFYGSLPIREYEKAIKLMEVVVDRWPNSPDAAEALWHSAFYCATVVDDAPEGWRRGLPYLERYYKDYPNAPRWENAPKWIGRFKERMQ